MVSASVDRDAAGIKAIVAYKLTKATLQMSLALALTLAGTAGAARQLQQLAIGIRAHAAQAWSFHLAELLVRTANPRNVQLVTIGLGLDGILSLVEGWSLHHRRWWAPWLIVVATSMLLPVEVTELVLRPTGGRAGLLFINALVVIYLARRISAERRSHARGERGENTR